MGQLVDEDLQRAGLPPTNHVHVEVQHLSSVYPVYEHSTIDARELINNWLRQSGRVVSLGRQGLGVPDNIHHVLAMGSRGAASLDASGIINPQSWRDSLDDFAQHVVQD